MKREAVSHTKMKRLCRRLDIPQWQGVGILESIWHLAAREAPRGDIGKLSDEDIALAIDYREDETKLIEALVASGWLDRDETGLLVVHDWHEHADDAVQMRLARARQFFVGGRPPKLSKLTGKERDSAHEFYSRAPEPAHAVPTINDSVRTDGAQNDELSAPPEPEPLPEPVPEPIPDTYTPEPVPLRVCVRTRAADLNGGIVSQRFDEFWERYPRQQRRDAAGQAWVSVVTVENESAVFACLQRYLGSGEVSRGVIANPDRWLFEQSRNAWSGDWPKPAASAGGDRWSRN